METWVKTLSTTKTRYGYLLEDSEPVCLVKFFDEEKPEYVAKQHIELVTSLAEEFFLV